MKRIIQSSPIRLLTAVPLCDGHDSAITTVNQELIRQGFEIVYMGYHRSAEDIVRAAIQEDVNGIGISSYNGGHIEFFRHIHELLQEKNRTDIRVFGGGGGTITPEDVVIMKEDGTDEIFLAGTPFDWTCDRLRELFTAKSIDLTQTLPGDIPLGQRLTAVEAELSDRPKPPARGKAKIIGITGPGGAGKTTLIDEWIRGALADNPDIKIGVLSHDPSSMSRGGLLGDRATMIYSQHDNIFLRSMATRGEQGGLSPATEECLQWMASAQTGFDLVLVETVGTGQEALPFNSELIDSKILVLHPEYGAQLQLQKILMLEIADVVVLNKTDWAGAARAIEEIKRQVNLPGSSQAPVYSTNASKHKDAGVVELRKHFSL